MDFRVLLQQVNLTWRLAISSRDFLLQFFLLLHDPIYRGGNMQRGAGQPILLIPAFWVGDWTLWVMAGWLQRLGYRPYLSGITWNALTPKRTGEFLIRRLMYIVRETGRPVIIIGHSLGGTLARFLGSYLPVLIFPELVRHMVTLGSPISPSPYAAPPFLCLARLALQDLGKMAEGAPADLTGVIKKVSTPLPAGVGFTAIFSIQDEIVDWRACVEPQGDNHPVSGQHLGLVVNREVYRVLADILEQIPEPRRIDHDATRSNHRNRNVDS